MSCRHCVCLQRKPHLACRLGGGEICAEDVDGDEDGEPACIFTGPFKDWRTADRARRIFVAMQPEALGEQSMTTRENKDSS